MSQSPGVDPPLVGRDRELLEIVELARAQPGVIIVWGEVGVGRERVARDAAAAIAGSGDVLQVPAGPRGARERIQETLRSMERPDDIVRALRGRPLVFVVAAAEDQADEALAPLLRETPGLAILCATGPGAVAPSVHVPRLDDGKARAILDSVAPGLDEARADRVVEIAGGMPGVLVALGRAAAALPAGAPVQVPGTIRQTALSAFADAEDARLAIAQWIALFDGTADIALLAGVDERPELEVERIIDGMLRDSLLVENLEVDPPTLSFAQRVVGHALLAEMGPNELRRRHTAALAAVRHLGRGPEAQLVHALGAGKRAEAVELALAAAEQARARTDVASAGRLADVASEHWRPEDGETARARAHRERGHWLSALGAWDQAVAEFERAATIFRRTHDEAAAIDVAVASALADWNRLDHVGALDRLVGFLDRNPDEPSTARAEALVHAAQFAGAICHNLRSFGFARRARLLGLAADAVKPISRGLAIMGMARSGFTGRPALRYLDRARVAALRLGDHRTASITYMWSSHLLLQAGEVRQVESICHEGLEFAEKLGIDDHEAVLIGNIGEARAAMGDLEAARHYLDLAADACTRLGIERPTFADPGLGMLLVAEGRFEEAVAHYAPLVDEELLDRYNFPDVATIATGYALAMIESGAPDEARGVVLRILDAWSRTDDCLYIVPVLGLAAEICEEEVAVRATADLARIARLGATLAPPFLLTAAASVRGDTEPERSADLHRRAAAEFDARGLAWWAARSMLAAGATGATEQAAADLQDARGRFARMPSGPWRQRAEAALRASGRRVGSRGAHAVAHIDGLSTREEEVLRHIMTGASNREIGDRLFIAERTVARHVGEILNKLGVSRRTHAAEVARNLGLEPAEAPARAPARD